MPVPAFSAPLQQPVPTSEVSMRHNPSVRLSGDRNECPGCGQLFNSSAALTFCPRLAAGRSSPARCASRAYRDAAHHVRLVKAWSVGAHSVVITPPMRSRCLVRHGQTLPQRSARRPGPIARARPGPKTPTKETPLPPQHLVIPTPRLCFFGFSGVVFLLPGTLRIGGSVNLGCQPDLVG